MSLEQRISIVKAERVRLRFRLATEQHWISGSISTIHQRLLDLLNSDFGAILLSEETSIHNFLTKHEPTDTADSASIRLSAVLFAIPVMDRRVFTSTQDPMVWIKKRKERVRVGIGPYEIFGHLHLAEGANMNEFLGSYRDRFIPMTDVNIKRVDALHFKEDYDTVLVNREKIVFLTSSNE